MCLIEMSSRCACEVRSFALDEVVWLSVVAVIVFLFHDLRSSAVGDQQGVPRDTHGAYCACTGARLGASECHATHVLRCFTQHMRGGCIARTD